MSETRAKAIGEYLALYPPTGFLDRYSAEGWETIARAVLSVAEMFPDRSVSDKDRA